MKYLSYFAVATPLVLGWLLWAAWVTPPPQVPLISPTGLNAVANEIPASPATIRNAAAGIGNQVAGKSSDHPSIDNKG
jgi:hypothetical protein